MIAGKYIFLTTEGHTFQPGSDLAEPDIENVQVLGFAAGENSLAAFKNFIKENPYIKDTTFKEVFSYKLDENYESTRTYHHIDTPEQ